MFKTLSTNAETSRRVTELIVSDLQAAVESGDILSEEMGSMKYSIMPRSEAAKEEDVKKLAFILPTYFK